MALFIVPPPQFIADYQEIPKQIFFLGDTYQNKLLKELGINQQVSKLIKGPYSGTRIFNWQQKYDAILITSNIFEKGSGFKKEWIKTASIIRQEDCVHIGSLWSYADKKIISFPLNNSTDSISLISSRIFNTLSPLKIDTSLSFSMKAVPYLFNLILQEEFSKNKILTISNEGRYFCKAQNLRASEVSEKQKYITKPHRLLEIKVKENGQSNSVPQVSYTVQMNGGVFGQKNKELILSIQKELFDPLKIANNIVKKVTQSLHDLTKEEFKIVKRYGSWVYLNRGRAYGLTIGMRLVGEHNSKLHIIRYAPQFDLEIDSSIAFIRHESQDTPLQVGDILKVDQMVYPR